MSKTRKLLSVVVALMMVVSMFAMTANAAYYYEDEDEAAKNTQTWALSEPVENSDGTYSVDVLLTTNYATGPIQFVLTNTNPEVAAIKNVTLGAAIPDGSDEGESNYNATVSFSKAKGKVMIIANTAGVATITAEEINGVIATVVYTYSGSGSATIAIENDAKSATNVGGSLIAARMSNGNLVTGDPIIGQTVTVGNSVVIGSAAQAPTLAVIDGTIGVIDTSRTEYGADLTKCTGYIYGIEPENSEMVSDVFEVVGDGEMEVIPTDSSSEDMPGTGTIVNVLDLDGNVVETYVLIIFGDVNGDGEATPVDASDIELHDGGMYGVDPDTGDDLLGLGGCLSVEATFAGDVDGDEEATPVDASDIELHDGGMYGLDPDTGDDNLGLGGRITQEYVISLF